MSKKKAQETGPSSFLEWVVGTTVQSATRPRNTKSTRRDRIRIELSTDDEDETDSLRITYPRSGRTAVTKAAGTKGGSKEVRFEDAPRKSALKKTTTTVTEVKTDEESTDGETSEEEKPVRKRKEKKGKREEESEEDSEQHSVCQCTDCIRARQKTKKKGTAQKGIKKNVSESEDSGSDSEISSRKSTKGKKSETESESEDFGSEPESKKNKKDKQQKGGKKDKSKTTEESSADEEKPSKKDKKQQTNEANSSKKRHQQKKQDGNKRGNYPEGLPEPHPRRPNYIEPVRAEVVQTERVIEGPEDPKPNAYYDAEHNIIRVYHGPVYGQNQSQGLYPKRDPNSRPLPMGTPHPSQNPWFNGFKDGQGEANVPVTQGMPMNSMYPPPGPYGYPPPHMGYPGPPLMEGGWNRGAFAQMSGANGQGENKSATNNVGPGSVKAPSLEGKNNPYYQHATGHGRRSKFSDWGSNKGSRNNDNANNSGPSNNDGARHSNNNNNDNNSWNMANINTSTAASWNGEPAQLSGQQDSFPLDSTDDWAKRSNSNKGDQDGAAASWDNATYTPAADDWGTVHQTSNTNEWDVNSSSNNWNAPPATPPKSNVGEENNVAPVETMPGAWDSTPAWGDLSAAAATGGAVDNEVNDGLPYGGW